MGKHRIEEILHRRDDLSTFVVHLTTSLGSLASILRDRTLKAFTSYGASPRNADHDWDPPKVVCLSEAPLAHVWTLCAPIEGRSYEFRPYGLMFSRNWARAQGCNPVFYSDSTRRGGGDWPTTLLDKAYDGCDTSGRQALAEFTRFVEPMGTHSRVREWWWEREWRHIGDLPLDVDHLVAVLCAADDRGEIDLRRSDGRPVPVIDPRWSLETTLLVLSGADPSPWPFPSSDLHPSPVRPEG